MIIGNPPWINYNQTADTLRTELKRQSKELYGIWTGGRYATHQDVGGLFFTRCTDLYLKNDGIIGMVMPHSALQAGQYSKWRSGAWRAGRSGAAVLVDFSYRRAWDLERLEPNNFFPVPASVVFAKRVGLVSPARPLDGYVERWLGAAGSPNVEREAVAITDTSAIGESPYAAYSRQGATIVPRCLFFVNEVENPAIVQAGQTVTVNPRRGSQDKDPWKNLDLTVITNQTVESEHLFDVHLGETLVPYATLEPLKALLPLKRCDVAIPADADGVEGIRLGGLDRRMRDRWQIIGGLWDSNKAAATRLNLLGQLDYIHKLSYQLEWQQNPGERPIKVVYPKAGQPTAALFQDDKALVDVTLYWVSCSSVEEAFFLLAVINSLALYNAVELFMSKGQFGARDLHKQLWKLPIPNSTRPNLCTYPSPTPERRPLRGLRRNWSNCVRNAAPS